MWTHAAACALAGDTRLLLLALPIGVLIGLAGAGGVLLVPLLSTLGGCSESDAIALSLASFIALGFVSLVTYVWENGAPARAEQLMFGTMIPGAVVGALLVPRIPENALALLVAIAVTCAGVWAVRTPRERSAPFVAPDGVTLGAIGGITGVTSALSGTGGPLVLMPLLLVRGVAIGDALAFGRIAQFPIALSATLARGVTAGLDVAGAAALSAALLVGMVAGAQFAKRVPAHALENAAGFTLVLAGLALGTSAVQRFVR